jgi:hypothetical protein
MACDVVCTNWGENMGKDTQIPRKGTCGNWGEDFYNDYGYDEDDE